MINREEILEKINFSEPLKLILENNLVNFHPWIFIVNDNRFELNYWGIKERYPHTNLIVFALRLDCDDKACFDLNDNNKIVVIHDYSTVAYEERVIYDTFWDWFKAMIEEFIEFNNDDNLLLKV